MTKIVGKVRRGMARGKALGFPTANLDANTESLEEGIFVAHCQIGDEEKFASLLFVGKAETFGETEKHAEVYILDFDQDLYGKSLEVEILDKIRDNIKYDNQIDLIEQMKRDEAEARKYFGL